jgi:cyclohexa-1,5-dienecarbonyl-CoA hydratase
VNSPLNAEVKDSALVLTLNRPKANIVDREMMAALHEALTQASDPSVKAVVLQAAGTHFSFGASVEEHTPEAAPKMLAEFHALLKEMLKLPVPMLAAVRGQCLGGAMELVLACSYVAVHPQAKLGQPEIKLASFAPVASVLLPMRIGQGRAEHLLLSGVSIDAPTAVQYGVADVMAGDPEAAVHAYVVEHLKPLSRIAITFALKAARAELIHRFETTIDRLEHLYVDGLLKTHDAKEGIAAFIQKRPPVWTGR